LTLGTEGRTWRREKFWTEGGGGKIMAVRKKVGENERSQAEGKAHKFLEGDAVKKEED